MVRRGRFPARAVVCQTLCAVLLTVAVERLGYTVGIQKQRIAGVETYRLAVKNRVAEHAHRKTGGGKQVEPSTMKYHGGQMPRVAKLHLARRTSISTDERGKVGGQGDVTEKMADPGHQVEQRKSARSKRPKHGL